MKKTPGIDPKKLTPLPREFFNRPTLQVARDLLGRYLVRRLGSELLVGKIVETEAYIGEGDPACHAARGKTPRNAVMYGPPGYAYIYFIYGMYFCLNVVTEEEGFPAAVLIRAVEPIMGMETMAKLRKQTKPTALASGPGKLCQAFSLTRDQNGLDLCTAGEVFLAEGEPVPDDQVVADGRIGIREGNEHPWRFFVKKNPHVSRPTPVLADKTKTSR